MLGTDWVRSEAFRLVWPSSEIELTPERLSSRRYGAWMCEVLVL